MREGKRRQSTKSGGAVLGIAQIFPAVVSFCADRPSDRGRRKSGQDWPARMGRDNLFRGLLFCDCCGHPLTLSRKKLKDREVDIYLCTHHNRRPDECPKTHIIYHEVLYPYVLEQIRALARSMRRRRVNSPICRYAEITELTPEILKEVVVRISVAHVPRKAKPARIIQIHWRFT